VPKKKKTHRSEKSEGGKDKNCPQDKAGEESLRGKEASWGSRGEGGGKGEKGMSRTFKTTYSVKKNCEFPSPSEGPRKETYRHIRKGGARYCLVCRTESLGPDLRWQIHASPGVRTEENAGVLGDTSCHNLNLVKKIKEKKGESA